MKRFFYYCILLIPLLFISTRVKAQIGEYRNSFAIGINGGITLNTINFLPNVNQKMYMGKEGGFMVRYTCEKYFKTICSIQAEINYAQLGWNEDIIDNNDQPVPSLADGSPEYYKRTINYIQVPLLAHLAWGKEIGGTKFFFVAGPQFGFYQSESTDTNFTIATANLSHRSSQVIAQDSMAVENKFDYGITAGIGIETHIRHVGRFQLEARYYYGLGNIYGDTKRDYFAKSNHGTISVRLGYMIDLNRKK